MDKNKFFKIGQKSVPASGLLPPPRACLPGGARGDPLGPNCFLPLKPALAFILFLLMIFIAWEINQVKMLLLKL